jgi:DNA-binding CsgD family transcriptional regulator
MGDGVRERARDRIATLATRGLDIATFFREAEEALERAVPASGQVCWSTLDPASLLITGAYSRHVAEAPDEIFAWEYLEDDVLKSADVARDEQGIQTLHEATGGDPSRSLTYREFLRPMGLEHAVEVALRTRTGEAWGSLALMREAGQPAFSDQEQEFLRSVSRHLAAGVRRGLLVGEAADPEGPDAPGLVVLDGDWTVESLTPGVERWLGTLPGRWEAEERLPPSVVAVAARALRTAESPDVPGEIAVARVLSRDGRWILLHGAALVANGTRRAAVIVEPAHPARITSLLMAAYGLTRREQEVTRLVLSGHSTSEIAAVLFVSPHTVQQHLKSIFDKTGVHSRRELVGKVFFAHYEPRLRDNERRVARGEPVRGAPVTAS